MIDSSTVFRNIGNDIGWGGGGDDATFDDEVCGVGRDEDCGGGLKPEGV